MDESGKDLSKNAPPEEKKEHKEGVVKQEEKEGVEKPEEKEEEEEEQEEEEGEEEEEEEEEEEGAEEQEQAGPSQQYDLFQPVQLSSSAKDDKSAVEAIRRFMAEKLGFSDGKKAEESKKKHLKGSLNSQQ